MNQDWFDEKSKELAQRYAEQLHRLSETKHLVRKNPKLIENREYAEWYFGSYIDDATELRKSLFEQQAAQAFECGDKHMLRLYWLIHAKLYETKPSTLAPDLPEYTGNAAAYACSTIIVSWRKGSDGQHHPPQRKGRSPRDSDPAEAGETWFKRLKQRIRKRAESGTLDENHRTMSFLIEYFWID